MEERIKFCKAIESARREIDAIEVPRDRNQAARVRMSKKMAYKKLYELQQEAFFGDIESIDGGSVAVGVDGKPL